MFLGSQFKQLPGGLFGPVRFQDSIARLRARHGQIKTRIETMYLDKLEGRIGQDFFDQKAREWRKEQENALQSVH